MLRSNTARGKNIWTSTLVLGLGALVLAGCATEPKQLSFEEIREICEGERRKAAGPTGSASFAITDKGAMQSKVRISVNDKFLRGADPDAVYAQCIDTLSARHDTSLES